MARALTDTELRVLQLVARGYTDKKVGEELGMAEKTVGTHMTAVRQKLHVHNRTHAVAIALCRGLIEC